MRSKIFTACAGFVALALACAHPAAAQTIGPGGVGNVAFGIAGTASVESVGQSFASPGGNLTMFTIRITTVATGGNVRFVFAPLAGMTAGTPLYTSADTPIAADTTLTFSGFSIPTTLNDTYIGYLTTFGTTGPAGEYRISMYSPQVYAGGTMLLRDGPDNPTGKTFSDIGTDAAFTATFAAAAPEPASWAMMIGGFAIIGGAHRLRRRKALLAA